MITTAATNTKTITRDELADMLGRINGATFATLHTRTRPKLTKKHRDTKAPCPWTDVTKAARINVCLGHDYESSVNRQRAREGGQTDFEAHELPSWLEVVSYPVLRHAGSGKLYLACKVERVYATAYHDETGNLIKPADLAGYLPKPKPSGGGRQDVERAVKHVTYALDSIEAVTMDHVTYIVSE